MANLNLYSARDLGDDAWNAYMQYKSQVFMSLAKDQAEYIIAIEKLVREDAPSYRGEIIDKDTGVTDFDYLRDQLTRAKEIYCMGIPCTDPGQDGPAQLIGMLDRNFNKIYDIHLNTQDWIEQAAGEGGWMKRIALAQSKFGGKEGTEDASVVFNALVKFREEKDGMLRADAAKSLDGHIEYLGEWSDMQAQIKMFDLPNAEGIYDDQTLNYISPNEPGYEENMLLFKAIERMKVGDVVKAEEYHDLWTKGYPERKRQDAVETRRKDKVVTDFGIAQDAIIEKAWTDHDTNVRGSIEALDGLQSQVKDGRGFHKDFTGSVQWYMPAINWDKGSLNMETVTERKAYVSDNLSYWMDNNAWGDAYDDWQKAVDHSYKVNVKPDSKEPLFGDEIMKRLALEYYFLNMDESDVLKLAQGGQGLPWVAPKGLEKLWREKLFSEGGQLHDLYSNPAA